jgi:hypothetical protein
VTTVGTITTGPDARFDRAVVTAAAAVEDAMRTDLMRLAGQEAAVVAAAPAGAGKSHFVSATVGQLRAEGLKVALVAPTNEQVHSLVARVKQLNPGLPVAIVHAEGRELPAATAALPGVTQPSAVDARARGDQLVVATVDKLADAFLRCGLGGFDVLVIDEAFQADAARYYTAAGVAPTHLLVGDTGQLDPCRPLTTPPSGGAAPRTRCRQRLVSCGGTIRALPSIAFPSPGGWILAQCRSPAAFTLGMLSALPSGRAFVNSGSPAQGQGATRSLRSTAPWTRRQVTDGRMSRSPERRF